MEEPWVELMDVSGPYAGQVRPYRKSAAEIALATGFSVLPSEVGTALPEDLPGRDALVAAEIDTLERLAEVPDLTAVPGIGKATARKIEAALRAGG